MRAHEHAFSALNAELFVPHRDLLRDVALLPHRGPRRERSVQRHRADRQIVSASRDDRAEHIANEGGSAVRHGRKNIERTRGVSRNRHRMQTRKRVVHCREVLIDHRIAPLAIRLANRFLDCLDRLLPREHAADREEAGLHDRVDSASHPRIASHRITVDHVELQVFVDDRLLHASWQVVPHFVRAKRRIQQERRTGLRCRQHVRPLQELELVARNEIGPRDEIRPPDRTRSKTQVGNRHGAGFLRVVHKVALRVVVGVLSDNLDRVLVRAHRAVGAETVEKRPDGPRILRRKLGIIVEARVRDVVANSNGEMVLGRSFLDFVEHRFRHSRRKFLRREAVPAADHTRRPLSVSKPRFVQGRQAHRDK